MDYQENPNADDKLAREPSDPYTKPRWSRNVFMQVWLTGRV